MKTFRQFMIFVFILLFAVDSFDYCVTGYGDFFYHIGRLSLIIALAGAAYLLYRKNKKFFYCYLYVILFKVVIPAMTAGNTNGAYFFGQFLSTGTLLFFNYKLMNSLDSQPYPIK